MTGASEIDGEGEIGERVAASVLRGKCMLRSPSPSTGVYPNTHGVLYEIT